MGISARQDDARLEKLLRSCSNSMVHLRSGSTVPTLASRAAFRMLVEPSRTLTEI
jgi:hypothetical protein